MVECTVRISNTHSWIPPPMFPVCILEGILNWVLSCNFNSTEVNLLQSCCYWRSHCLYSHLVIISHQFFLLVLMMTCKDHALLIAGTGKKGQLICNFDLFFDIFFCYLSLFCYISEGNIKLCTLVTFQKKYN